MSKGQGEEIISDNILNQYVKEEIFYDILNL